jgi:putative ABC transport system substrate-binding protein
MRRRVFLLSSAALAIPLPAVAQQVPAVARVGWLAHGDTMPRHFFEDALVRLGWVEGRNLIVQRRFAGSAGELVTSAAAELRFHPTPPLLGREANGRSGANLAVRLP